MDPIGGGKRGGGGRAGAWCLKCGASGAPEHLRNFFVPGGGVRLCALCWNEFWEWMGARSAHSGRHEPAGSSEGLGLHLCVICRCELERWLRPLPPERSGGSGGTSFEEKLRVVSR